MVNQNQLSNFYSGKKVFITGHTGFKGAWLMAWLKLIGAKVKGYALAPDYNLSLYDTLGYSSLEESIIDDIRNKHRLLDEIKSFCPDYIFHLAAQPLVRKSYKFPSETFEVNAIGTANLLESIIQIENKCTVIIITTDKVYENKEQNILYNESDILGGYDPYSASKACTELVVSSFRNSFFNLNNFDRHKKALASVRAGNVIGGGDFNEDRLIPDIIKSLRSSNIINVRNPNAIRPWQHVLEPLGGYLLLGGLLNENPLNFSGAYNFGPKPSDHLAVKELVEIAIEKWGGGEWKDISDYNQPHEAGILKLDIRNAKEKLGWEPKLSSNQSIEWTVNWYKQADSVADYTLQQINDYMLI